MVLGATREPKAEHKARSVVQHLDASVVQFGDSGDKAQAETNYTAAITHNPKEYSTKEQIARGAQVLLDAVLELAGV